MSFELKYAIIHSFTKESKQSYATNIVKKTALLKNELPAVMSLVQGVSALLGKPGNILSYGQFSNDMRQGKFPAEFDCYSSKPLDPAAFISMSHLAVDELAAASESESFSTGGHILVSYYLVDNKKFVLVAMIKQRGGVSLDKDYVPIAVTEIDLSKVHQAARINLSRYVEVASQPRFSNDENENENEDVVEERTYLSFVGQGTHNLASGYFVKALGCTKGISSSRATGNVISAVRTFFSSAELKPHRSAACNGVIAYLKKKLDAKENAVLNDLVYAAIVTLTEGQSAVIDDLKEFLNDERTKIPAEFAIHAPTLRKKTMIKGETANWTVQFEQGMLGLTANAAIIYNENKKTLTFTNLGKKLISDIESELKKR